MPDNRTVEKDLADMSDEDRNAIVAASEDLWNELHRGDWLLTAAIAVGVPRIGVLFALCQIGRLVLPLAPEFLEFVEGRIVAPERAIDRAEAFADGFPVSAQELVLASRRSGDAARYPRLLRDPEGLACFVAGDVAMAAYIIAHGDDPRPGVKPVFVSTSEGIARQAATALAHTMSTDSAKRAVVDAVREGLPYRRHIQPLKDVFEQPLAGDADE